MGALTHHDQTAPNTTALMSHPLRLESMVMWKAVPLSSDLEVVARRNLTNLLLARSPLGERRPEIAHVRSPSLREC